MKRRITKLSPVRRGYYLNGWPNTNIPCCNNLFFFLFLVPSFSKAILKTAELPSLCNIVSVFSLSTFCFSVRHGRKQTAGHVARIILNSLDFWSFKTFDHGLNHSKIHTARQCCDFQCLQSFSFSAIEYGTPLKYWKWAIFAGER